MWFPKKPPVSLSQPSMLDPATAIFGNLSDIEQADCEKYSSCRGTFTRSQLIYHACVVCAATDNDLKFSSELDEMVYGTFLYDDICHQGTLYPITPIAAYYITKKVREIGLQSRFLRDFLVHLQAVGSGGICWGAQEIAMNKAGLLPIFRIEDLFDEPLKQMMSNFPR